MGIDKDKREPTQAAELRRRAEELLAAKTAEALPPRTDDESRRLLHELQVHQIELEMQNAELRRARDELETTLAQLTDLYDFAPSAYFTLERDGVIRGVNLTGASLLGIERSRLVGRRFDTFLSQDDRTAFIPFLGKVFENRGKEACEVELITDGKSRLHAQIEAVASASATDCRLSVVDITARREAEEELRESEKRYSSLFNNRYVVKLLIDPGTGKILNANPAACAFYGYSSEQFNSLRICDINTLPRHAILEKMGQALKAGGALFQFRHRLANGEIRDVEVYSGPIEIKEQKLLYSIIHDVTERRRMEEKLRNSEHQLADAQGIAHIGSWEWDAIADEITVSDEFNRIFGPVLSTYDSFLERVHPDDRKMVNKAVRETLDRQSPYNVHYRIVRPDGITRVIHALGKAVTERSGKTVRMIGTVQDVTESKKMEEKLDKMHAELAAHAFELEASNRDLEAFNAAVSHDLRAPLTNINGICQILLNLYTDRLDDVGHAFLRDIYAATLQMSDLIKTFLKFSRLSHCAILRQTVAFSEIAAEIAAELEKGDPERHCTFGITGGIVAEGDPDLLRVVLTNLLGNAWKYSADKKDALIEFGMTEHEGKRTYFVRDNGIGFDMARAEKLFTPFHRLPNHKDFTGHGIGLATVQRIISRHGGRIWAESEPDRGATFYFTL
jgi:PAS domain S-box-containing protein